MIRSFGSKFAEDLYDGIYNKRSRFMNSSVHKLIVRKLDQLNAVTKILDLNVPPGNRLEKLRGSLASCWSIRVNRQYRIIFIWDGEDAHEVDIVDYH